MIHSWSRRNKLSNPVPLQSFVSLYVIKSSYHQIISTLELAHTFAELDEERSAVDTDQDKLKVLFNEILQICLWYASPCLTLFVILIPRSLGEMPPFVAVTLYCCSCSNSFQDLSLLTNMTHEDIQKLQSVGRAAQDDRKEFILLDDSAKAWKVISNMKGGRVDLVLDNCMWLAY